MWWSELFKIISWIFILTTIHDNTNPNKCILYILFSLMNFRCTRNWIKHNCRFMTHSHNRSMYIWLLICLFVGWFQKKSNAQNWKHSGNLHVIYGPFIHYLSSPTYGKHYFEVCIHHCIYICIPGKYRYIVRILKEYICIILITVKYRNLQTYNFLDVLNV